MRLAIVSDIHGNLTALRAVQFDLDSTGLKEVVTAGDLALFGPYPEKCVQHVRDRSWQSVRGNTDRMLAAFDGMVTAGQIDAAGPVGRIAKWTRDRLGEELLSYLQSLPESIRISSDNGAGDLVVLHGTPGSDEVGLNGDDNDQRLLLLMQGVKAYAVVGGHTHKSFARMVGGTLFANAGSVGRSYEGRPGRATYVVVEDERGFWKAEIRQVRYDHRRNLRELEAEKAPIAAELAEPFMSAVAPS